MFNAKRIIALNAQVNAYFIAIYAWVMYVVKTPNKHSYVMFILLRPRRNLVNCFIQR